MEEVPETKSFTVFSDLISFVDELTPNGQLLTGALAGWVFGYLSVKITKPLLLPLGGAIILLQASSNHRLVMINWEEIDRRRRFHNQEIELVDYVLYYMDRSLNFFKSNSPLSNGILGGFFIGLCSCSFLQNNPEHTLGYEGVDDGI